MAKCAAWDLVDADKGESGEPTEARPRPCSSPPRRLALSSAGRLLGYRSFSVQLDQRFLTLMAETAAAFAELLQPATSDAGEGPSTSGGDAELALLARESFHRFCEVALDAAAAAAPPPAAVARGQLAQASKARPRTALADLWRCLGAASCESVCRRMARRTGPRSVRVAGPLSAGAPRTLPMACTLSART